MFSITQVALSNQPEDRAGTPLVVASRGRGADESGMVDLARLLLPGITLVAVIFDWIDVFAKSQVKIILLGFAGGTAMAVARCSPIRSVSPLRCFSPGPCPEIPGST
jgi:hypothetical protein